MSASSVNEFQRAFQQSVQQLKRDPEGALAVIFDLTARRLVRLAMAVTQTQSDAEDALQAAFSRIAAKPMLLVRAEMPWPYLIRAVRNEALRIAQKRRPGQLRQMDYAASEESAEQVLQREETAERVRRILRTLPLPQYEVVILKHWENLTFAEIAETTGKSPNTVASRYRYAMEKLHRSLEPVIRSLAEQPSADPCSQQSTV